jgi:hypothetical protein
MNVTNFPSPTTSVNVTNFPTRESVMNIIENFNLTWTNETYYSPIINFTRFSVANWRIATIYMRITNYTKVTILGYVYVYFTNVFTFGNTTTTSSLSWNSHSEGSLFQTWSYTFDSPMFALGIQGNSATEAPAQGPWTCLVSLGIYLCNN